MGTLAAFQHLSSLHASPPRPCDLRCKILQQWRTFFAVEHPTTKQECGTISLVGPPSGEQCCDWSVRRVARVDATPLKNPISVSYPKLIAIYM